MPADRPTLTCVIITWNRPTYTRDCLEHLARADDRPDQVIVVDASPGPETREVVRGFPGVTYVSFPGGAGHMTASRNEALRHATGEVIAFLDDDANATPGWAVALREAYQDHTIAAAAGRTCNGLPGEDVDGRDQIGRFRPDGTLTGNFAVALDGIVDIDHGIGANMSFRRSALAELGGFRTDYPGTALREDSDAFLRLRRLGLRAVFVPGARVDHVAAPHVKGRRFDRRYTFWAVHNHMLLCIRIEGLLSPVTKTWIRTLIRSTWRVHEPAARNIARAGFVAVALTAGLVNAALKCRGLGPVDDRSRSTEAIELRRLLNAESLAHTS